jgi:hypothetical protein
MANFRRVLEFDKFAGEWPLLSFNPRINLLQLFPRFFGGKPSLTIILFYYFWLKLFFVVACMHFIVRVKFSLKVALQFGKEKISFSAHKGPIRLLY